MHRRNQKSGRDADRLVGVIMFQFTAVRQPGESSNENGDEPGRNLEVGLVFVRAERAQRIQPLLRRPMLIEVPLFHFRGGSDPLLYRRI